MPLLAVLLFLGTAAAGMYNNYITREDNRSKAEYQKDLVEADIAALDADKANTLATMDAELAYQQTEDAEKAVGIQRAAVDDFTAGMQDTYLSEVAANSKLMDFMQQSAADIGTTTARSGASGARGDSTLMGILSKERNRQITEGRRSIDSATSASIGMGQMKLTEANYQAKLLRDKYNPDSEFMNLFNIRKQGVINKFDTDKERLGIQSNYLDDVIKDNTYEFGGRWFWADVFSVFGAGMQSAQMID